MFNYVVLMIVIIYTRLCFAQASLDNSENCISLNDNVENILELAKTGKYRHTLDQPDAFQFDFSKQPPFAQYIEYQRHKIIAQNPKGRLPCPIMTSISAQLYGEKALQVVDLIAPFQLDAKAGDTGVLLIHGLTDSPYMFHDLASEFVKQGVSVRTLLLPGHGTAPSALIDISEQQWREAARYAVLSMLEDFDTVFLGGFSTGGALVIDYLNQAPLSQAHQAQIKGVLLWSPATKAKSNMAWAAKYAALLTDYMDEAADIDFAKYESFPYNAAAQVHALMQRIRPDKLVNTPNIPLFVVASGSDETIDTDSTLAFLSHWHTQRQREEKKRDTLIYYGNEDALRFLPSRIDMNSHGSCHKGEYCESIMDIAHTAPTNAPVNPYYGWLGHYRNCEHIKDAVNYKICKEAPTPVLGATTTQNLRTHSALQRLTFNPYYSQMITVLTQFINENRK